MGNGAPSESSTSAGTLSIAGWRIHAPTHRMSKGEKTVKLEPRAMGVLVCLASRPGEVFKREQLEEAVWPRMVVGYDALSNTIRKLRKAFDDDPRHPRIIETIPKVGYRLIGEVSHPPPGTGSAAEVHPAPLAPKVPRRTLIRGVAALVALVIAVAIVVWFAPWGPSARKAPALPDGPSIAVLPFANLSDDKEQEYFADGLSDDLITSLSKISGVLVIARNSTFVYKGKPVNMQELRDALGVRYALEGSVRRAENQVRINAQLIDATTGGHVWAERYDGSMENIFALQDEITRKIVAALAVELTAIEKERVFRRGTDNIAAYDAFLLGWQHYLRETPEDLAAAVSHLRAAVRLDPNFARAHAALAEAYQRALGRGWWRALSLERWEVKEQLQQHLQIAEREPMPLAYQAKSRMLLRARKHDEAIAELERALVLDPNSFLGHIDMAWALTLSGQPENAARYAEKAMRLDPGTRARALWELGFAQFGMEQFEAAVASLERAIRLSPKLPQWPLMAAYTHLGNAQKAVATRRAYFKLRGWEGPHNVSTMLNYYPYKRRVDEKRFAKGLLGAGVPGYYELTENYRLTGPDVWVLVSGRTRTGINTTTGQQYWVTYAKDQTATRRGGRQGTDTGKAWVENDNLCEQWQRSLKGRKRCMSVYRNPGGTREGLDEYLSKYELFVIPWSVVD